MKNKRKIEISILQYVLLGSILAFLISIILTAGTAFLSDCELIDEENIKPISLAISFISVAGGTLLAGKCIQRRKLIAYLGIWIAYIGILLTINIIFFDGAFHNIIPRLLISLGGAIIAWFFLSSPKKTQKRKRYI